MFYCLYFLFYLRIFDSGKPIVGVTGVEPFVFRIYLIFIIMMHIINGASFVFDFTFVVTVFSFGERKYFVSLLVFSEMSVNVPCILSIRYLFFSYIFTFISYVAAVNFKLEQVMPIVLVS